MHKIICCQISQGSIYMTFMSITNASRQHKGCNGVKLHKAKNLAELDQFQKVYLSQSTDNLVLGYGKEAKGQLRNLNFECRKHVAIIIQHRLPYQSSFPEMCKTSPTALGHRGVIPVYQTTG